MTITHEDIVAMRRREKYVDEVDPLLSDYARVKTIIAHEDFPRCLDALEEAHAANQKLKEKVLLSVKEVDGLKDRIRQADFVVDAEQVNVELLEEKVTCLETLLTQAEEMARKVKLSMLCGCWSDFKCSGCVAEDFLNELKKYREGK